MLIDDVVEDGKNILEYSLLPCKDRFIWLGTDLQANNGRREWTGLAVHVKEDETKRFVRIEAMSIL